MKRFITMFLAVLTLLTVVPTKTLAEEASLYALGSCRTCGKETEFPECTATLWSDSVP